SDERILHDEVLAEVLLVHARHARAGVGVAGAEERLEEHLLGRVVRGELLEEHRDRVAGGAAPPGPGAQPRRGGLGPGAAVAQPRRLVEEKDSDCARLHGTGLPCMRQATTSCHTRSASAPVAKRPTKSVPSCGRLELVKFAICCEPRSGGVNAGTLTGASGS